MFYAADQSDQWAVELHTVVAIVEIGHTIDTVVRNRQCCNKCRLCGTVEFSPMRQLCTVLGGRFSKSKSNHFQHRFWSLKEKQIS